jgi:5-methylcytosine-specific restriction endonuclease McrA
VLARDAWLCQIRGTRCTDVATQVDHIQPLVMGGEKYDPSNCRAACQPCNLDRRVTVPRSTATPHSQW